MTLTKHKPLVTDNEMPPEDQLGPAMLALSPKMRRFVWHWLTNGGIAPRAVVAAGYSTANSHTVSVKACQLMSDERVLAAIHEQSWRMLHSLTPLALAAYTEILMAPGHKDRARIASEVLNRSGFALPVEIKHTVERTDRTPLTSAQWESIKALAIKAGIDPGTGLRLLKPEPDDEIEDAVIIAEHPTNEIEEW